MPSILSSIRQSLPAISSEPRGISGAAGSGDPFRQPIDPCPDSSASEAALPSFDNGSLAPPSQQQELASEPSNASSRFGMLAALAAGPLQPWWELERHDIMREIARPAGQATIGGAARDEVSLKNLIDDDVAHGAGRWWRERVMPYSPSDYIGEIGSYPIQGDRLRPPLFVKGGSDADEVSINDIKQQEINDYCICDVLDTYFVFLRSRILSGELTLEQEQELVAKAKEWIAGKAPEMPALQQYLANWGDWQPWP